MFINECPVRGILHNKANAMEEVYYLVDQFDRILLTVIGGRVVKVNIVHLVSEGGDQPSTKLRSKIMGFEGLTLVEFEAALKPIYKLWVKL